MYRNCTEMRSVFVAKETPLEYECSMYRIERRRGRVWFIYLFVLLLFSSY